MKASVMIYEKLDFVSVVYILKDSKNVIQKGSV